MKKCGNCGSTPFTHKGTGRSYILTDWITVTGRMSLCNVCAKHAVATDQVFCISDAVRDWENGHRNDTIKALTKFPRWVSLAFGFAILEHFGTAAYTTLASMMETCES